MKNIDDKKQWHKHNLSIKTKKFNPHVKWNQIHMPPKSPCMSMWNMEYLMWIWIMFNMEYEVYEIWNFQDHQLAWWTSKAKAFYLQQEKNE